MKNQLQKLKNSVEKEIASCNGLDLLRELEIKYLGRKGELTQILRGLSDLPIEEKKEVGPLANEIKEEITRLIEEKRKEFMSSEVLGKIKEEKIDVTQPGEGENLGNLHPNSIIQYELEDIFTSLGFMILDGPELESDYYNFEALNIPSWHPARDTQDTFYIKDPLTSLRTGEKDRGLLMRTHTSPVQVRAMQKYGAPLRCIVPGRTFRNEATDASHDHTFYQLEGFMIGEDIAITHLVAVMKTMLSQIFKKEVKVRLRPGYFPFVEPGFELDFQCLICSGKGCSVCSQTGWVEFVGSGLIHPNVLKYGGIDSKKYSGFAFGLGLTRLIMMKYGIDDIRLLQGGDLRFLKQF